nr:MAG TPA: hypothetical protein [Caudoviricetes sp.]
MVILNKIIFCVLDKGLQYFSLRTIYISINKVTVSWGISRLVSFVDITYNASKQNLSIIDVTNSLLFFLLFAMYNIPNRNMIINIVYQIIPHSPILSFKVTFVNKKGHLNLQVSFTCFLLRFQRAMCSLLSLFTELINDLLHYLMFERHEPFLFPLAYSIELCRTWVIFSVDLVKLVKPLLSFDIYFSRNDLPTAFAHENVNVCWVFCFHPFHPCTSPSADRLFEKLFFFGVTCVCYLRDVCTLWSKLILKKIAANIFWSCLLDFKIFVKIPVFVHNGPPLSITNFYVFE